MESVRSKRLDNICEAIGEERRAVNAAKQEEVGLIASALQVMQREDVTVYRHARVELSRVPGAEKLRVRLTKEDGDADASDLESDDTTDDTDAGEAAPDEDVDDEPEVAEA
jgi:hypothetical protein